jgi:hypothetical protein
MTNFVHDALILKQWNVLVKQVPVDINYLGVEVDYRSYLFVVGRSTNIASWARSATRKNCAAPEN